MIGRCALAALLLACCANAATTHYSVNPTYSSVGFSIVKWSVIKEEGIFRDFSGTLAFDPAHPDSARIDVVVRATSVDTKDSMRDEVVRSDDFLDVNQFPTLEFHSASIQRVGAQTFVTGDLTIHGTRRRVRFPVTQLGIREVPHVGRIAAFETTFTINRRDFGVLGSRWGAIPATLSDDIIVHIVIGGFMREP